MKMTTITYEKLENVYDRILKDFQTNSEKTKLDLIYAFNGTGKTRISRMLDDNFEDKVLCFNSMFLDEFSWNNSNVFLVFNNKSWIANFIKEQGLENQIEKNFEMFCDNSVVSSIDLELGIVEFFSSTEIENKENIKISKAEESIFIWSVFYTFIDQMISELSEEVEDRSTHIFDMVEYLVIDDPVSSIDDVKILNIAIRIIELIDSINKIKNNNISVLITTHHALFYNAIYNLTSRLSYVKFKSYVLTKEKGFFNLSEKGDSPFGYHLILVSKIKNAIKYGNIEKVHFNMFRILLEKTSNYFGYKQWDQCIPDKEYKKEIVKLINLYSHGNLPEFEYSSLTNKEKSEFVEAFNDFISYYKMEVEDE